MTLVCGQYDDARLTKLVLGITYEADRNNGNLVNFLDQLQVVGYQNDDGGLSYTLYKGVIILKLLHIFTNPRPEDHHGYKKEFKVKNSAMTEIAGKFPSGT